MEHSSGFIVVKNARRRCAYFLAASWLTGLILGVWLSCILKVYSVPLMSAATGCRVTFGGLCLTLFLPCLVYFAAYKSGCSWSVYVLTSIRGIYLGHAIPAALWAFGTAAWLLLFLLTFSNFMIQIPLLDIGFRCVSTRNGAGKKSLVYLAFVAVVIGLIDYFLVSPSMLML